MSADGPHAPPPLTGLVVVDLSSDIAGAYCTKMLADGGAEVVMVEPVGGSPLRQRADSRELAATETGALFEFLGCTKQSVVASTDDDERLVEPLLRSADVIVWTEGTDVAGRFPPERLRRLAPSATVCAITPFGLSSPWSGRPAADLSLQAWSGGIFGRGTTTAKPPVRVGGQPGQWMAGLVAAVGGIASRTGAGGRGELIDVSVLDALTLASHMYPVTVKSAQESLGLPPIPPKPRSANIPAIHRARDGWVGFMVVTPTMWESFCIMIERPDLADDKSLHAYGARRLRRVELETAISSWIAARTVTEITELAALLRVPAAPVSDGRTVTSVDHFIETGAFLTSPRSGHLQPAAPYRFGAAFETAAVRPAPAIGEHTDENRHRVRLAKSDAAEPAHRRLPFEGLKIADFTSFWAGPFASHVFAMLGADVVHVESPRRPDGMRGHSFYRPDHDRWWEYTAAFHGPNTNKLGVAVDIRSDEGVQLARRLALHCGVLVENYSPRVLDHWGLGYDALRAERPDMILVRMPAFGLSGPWRDRTGYAQTMEQASGMAWVTGYPDGPPQNPNGLCDPLAGLHAAAALMMALEHRRRTGEGCQVEVPMVRSALNIAAQQTLEYQAYGHVIDRSGNEDADAPHDLYLCSDVDDQGVRDVWVAIAVEADEHWTALRGALGDPAWTAAPELDTRRGRQAARAQLDRHMVTWCEARSSQQIVAELWDAGVPVGVVREPGTVHHLPHHVGRASYESVTHALVGNELHISFPARFPDRAVRLHRRPAPLLGEHNDTVLGGWLGLTTTEMAALAERGVIGDRLLI